ncbi:hypothetical protein SAMN04489844_0340 [Nocardioides exalbidus]|uniref:PKD domain-containing protein n=1 Tax=Nocardioides exalbidus TaxID=402596 RepID=A0A1H4JXE5_9ACTN|nr:PKD domain-containing protein [Nocardioides exalbidus]SEB50843.1 hypothetical protein SAMN04489844_0340 [Nocardioides exalbidus]
MERRTQQLVVAVAASVVGATLVAAPTAAAPTWQPVTNVFVDLSAGGQNAHTPDVGVDAAGNATAVWSRYDGTQLVVQASSRPAGGAWSAPVDIAGGPSIFEPQVAVEPGGAATVVWRRNELGSSVVLASTRPIGGSWSPPVEVASDASRDLSQKPDFPQVAAGADGAVTATWSHFDGRAFIVQAASRQPDGTWSAPQDLSEAGARNPDVAVSASGVATVLWTAGSRVQAVTRTAGTWSAPVDLSSTAAPTTTPDVALDPAGNATAVWGGFTGASYVVQTATRPAAGDWINVTNLSSPGVDAFDTPQVAVDARGRATAVWQENDGSGWIVTAATGRIGRDWSARTALSAAGQDAWTPQVDVDTDGNATAVWSLAGKDGDTARTVQAARLPARGDWTSPVDLSEPGGNAWNPALVVDADGNATTAWSRHDGAHWIVQARGLDAAGPVVTGITSRHSGARTSYSVTAHDVWSKVRTARWTFADGTTATGTSVTHQSRSTRPVRVTLTDAVGNATRCTYAATFRCREALGAPAITSARLEHRTIRATRGRGTVPTESELTLELSTAARVRVVVRPLAAGTPLRLTGRVKAGRGSFLITARLGRFQVLRPGRYAVVVTATNKAGTSPKHRLRLRVVR